MHLKIEDIWVVMYDMMLIMWCDRDIVSPGKKIFVLKLIKIYIVCGFDQ